MSSSNSASSSSKSGGTGVIPVQTAPMDGTSPRDAAINYRNQQIASQSQMNKQYSGGKKRKYRGGGGTSVPQFSIPGPPVGAGQQNPNAASVSTNTTLTQGGANAACDKCIGPASASAICQGPQCNPNATMKGGCASCGGVMPFGQTWTFLSGGKKSKKSNKSKKSKKSNKSKKSKKSKPSKKSKKSKK